MSDQFDESLEMQVEEQWRVGVQNLTRRKQVDRGSAKAPEWIERRNARSQDTTSQTIAKEGCVVYDPSFQVCDKFRLSPHIHLERYWTKRGA